MTLTHTAPEPVSHDTAPASGQQPGTTGSPRVRTVMAVVLALLLLGSAVAAGVLLDKRADVESALDARRDVVRVAERFTVQVNNYDSGSVDDYKASVGAMLSTKFRDEFDQAMEDIVKSVQQAKMDSKGSVLAAGVATVDQDSARVLVAADAGVKTVFDDRQRHFRWEVSLVRVDGEWLVDDFTPVG
jgi:Mce-associated membrane protein